MTARRKTALVTGAASGIGAAAALALARAGYDVAINYSRSVGPAREVAAQAQRLGAQTLLCPCDVADDAGVRAMLNDVAAKFEWLDALINNAGTTTGVRPKDFDSLTVEEWDRVFAVNVRGIFSVTRAALPLLRKAPHPAIVNTASIVGLRPGP
ncbi:MAG: SDR family NAD(P)-dependent oxidoreductase, partial [Stellaceae bacterium]